MLEIQKNCILISINLKILKKIRYIVVDDMPKNRKPFLAYHLAPSAPDESIFLKFSRLLFDTFGKFFF